MRKPRLPKGYFLWSESLRRKWVDDYNRSLPERNERRMQKREGDRKKYLHTPTPDGFQWVNCETNPNLPAFGYDAGRTAWKFHAVMANPEQRFVEMENKTSACGLRPRYGWTLDLFMDEDDAVAGKCMRCLKALAAISNAEKQQ